MLGLGCLKGLRCIGSGFLVEILELMGFRAGFYCRGGVGGVGGGGAGCFCLRGQGPRGWVARGSALNIKP